MAVRRPVQKPAAAIGLSTNGIPSVVNPAWTRERVHHIARNAGDIAAILRSKPRQRPGFHHVNSYTAMRAGIAAAFSLQNTPAVVAAPTPTSHATRGQPEASALFK